MAEKLTYREDNTLTILRIFDARIDFVWKALTDIDLIKQWSPFFPDFKPEVGFESRFLLGPDKDHQYLHICKVTEVNECAKITYSWKYEGYAGNSLVTFELFSAAEKTNIIFIHKITEPFPADNEDFSKNNFIEGWMYTVDALQKFVEKKK